MTRDDAYIVVNPAVAAHKFNVVIMRLARPDEYEVFRISQALTKPAADALALSWSAATGLEVKG